MVLNFIVFLLFVFSSIMAYAAPGNLYTDSLRHFSIASFAEDSFTTVIPFSRSGNLILLKAKADSIEGNFILDTGAPHLVLNITYFRDHPTTEHHDEQQNSINGASPVVVRTTVKQLSFGRMDYFHLNADLVNLGHIENSRGVKIIGLLGMDLFRKCEMIIDYEKNLVYLHRIGKKESSKYKHQMLMDTSAYRTIPIDITDNRIIATTYLAGKKLKLVVDCAAESNILDSRLPDKIFETVTITKRVLLTGSNKKKVEALYVKLATMKIGNQDFGNMPVLITNLEGSCFSYSGCVDGVLGFDFLSLHKIGFNFVRRKMYIWK